MHPLFLNTESFAPLKDAKYQLILAANGLFQARENAAFRAVVPVAPPDERATLQVVVSGQTWDVDLGRLQETLQPLQQCLELKLRVARRDFRRAEDFFREVYRQRRTEAFVFLAYDPATGATGLVCPEQTVDRASVEVDANVQFPDGWLCYGTCHSHPCDAFHRQPNDYQNVCLRF